MLRFCNFRLPPPPCEFTYAFSLHPLTSSRSTTVQILFFKEDMTETCFVNYYQSKNHKQRYKIKRILCKTIGKCRIKTPRKALGIKVTLSNCMGEWEWIILAV